LATFSLDYGAVCLGLYETGLKPFSASYFEEQLEVCSITKRSPVAGDRLRYARPDERI